ncbi:hypothetical protein [Azospirillum largimobile]
MTRCRLTRCRRRENALFSGKAYRGCYPRYADPISGSDTQAPA